MVSAVVPWLGLCLLGVVVGAFGTLIGAGGGFLLVPLLLLLYPDEAVKTVTAISLAVVFLNAASGSLAYARLRRIDYRTGLVFAAASVPGSVLGAVATGFLARGFFDLLFGLLLLGLGLYLLVQGNVVEGHAAPERVNLQLGAVLSFAVGFLSSVLGIGGGVIHVPLLIQFLGYPAHIATATSHFILALMSLAGTVTHVLTGEFEHGVRRTLALGVGVLIGAQIGAMLSQRVHGRRILQALAVGVLLIGLRLAGIALWSETTALAQLGARLAIDEQRSLQAHAVTPSTLGVLITVAMVIAGGAIWLVYRRARGRAPREHE